MTNRFATIVNECIFNDDLRHAIKDVPVLLMATTELRINPELTTVEYGDIRTNWRN